MQDSVFKRIICFLIVTAIAITAISVVYFSNLFKPAREIKNVDHLTGQRIGVVCAYEGDYILSDRDDVTLLRYDSEADLVVALCYRQVDALATTLDAANYILDKTTGLKINDTPIAESGMASIFREDDAIMHEFNDFIKAYRNTDEYKEYEERCNNQDYYDGSEITKETGTGKTIKLGYSIDYIPVTFLDAIHKCPNGSEVDIWRRFANYMDYKIEWVEATALQSHSELQVGNIDAILDGYNDVYRDEYEMSPYFDMGATYRDVPIVLVEVDNFGKVSIADFTEEIE